MKTENFQTFRTLDNLHASLLADVKSGGPIWEDIIEKSEKLFVALRATVYASNAFLDAIQKLADLASKTSGGSKEIGAHFTRLCMRQRHLGTKVKTMGNQLMTCMVNPLANHIKEWKRTLGQIEKEHNREDKRAQGELKRALSEVSRLKRKLAARKRQSSRSSTIGQGVGLEDLSVSSRLVSSTNSFAVRTESAVKVLEEKICRVADLERATIRRLMLEERGRYCFFFNCLRPVLETEASLLGEVSTLRELFTALSEAVADPSRLLEEAESVLAHTAAAVETRTCLSLNRPLRSCGIDEVEAFASAVDAIMSSQQRQQQVQGCEEAAPSLTPESLCSTSTERSRTSDCTNATGLRLSIHSADNDAFAPQQQMMALLRQSHVQNNNEPRSISVGRSNVCRTPRHITRSSDAEEVILRRPTINGACLISTSARQLPQILSLRANDTYSICTATAVTPVESISEQRHSTCTLQQLNATRLTSIAQRSGVKSNKKTGVNKNKNEEEKEEADEETTSGTLDSETSDNNEPADKYRPSNKEVGNPTNGELGRPLYPNKLTNEQRSPSRGNLQTMLYPDQALPPPVYTNLNQLTQAAQRKLSMSANVTSNDATVDTLTWQVIDERDNLSVASEPHTHSDQLLTKLGINSVPASPHRPSVPTSSSNPQHHATSTDSQDPFSFEMDELDRVITGSSPANLVNSHSGRRGLKYPSQPLSHPLMCPNYSTGIPMGLLRMSKSSIGSKGTELNGVRFRSSSLCTSSSRISTLDNPEIDGTSMESFVPRHLPTLGQAINRRPTSAFSCNGDDSLVGGDNHTKQVLFTATLLTQLSGQLQQLGSSNVTSLLKHSPNLDCQMSAEFDLPAPPSPQIPPPFTHI